MPGRDGLAGVDDPELAVLGEYVVLAEVRVHEVAGLPYHRHYPEQLLEDARRVLHIDVLEPGAGRLLVAHELHDQDVLLVEQGLRHSQAAPPHPLQVPELLPDPDVDQLPVPPGEAREPGVPVDVLRQALEHGVGGVEYLHRERPARGGRPEHVRLLAPRDGVVDRLYLALLHQLVQREQGGAVEDLVEDPPVHPLEGALAHHALQGVLDVVEHPLVPGLGDPLVLPLRPHQ